VNKPKSWSWRIVEFTASHHEWVRQVFGQRTHVWSTDCRKKGCSTIAECYVAYNYVTGRSGRVRTNKKPYCRAHAEELVRVKLKVQHEAR